MDSETEKVAEFVSMIMGEILGDVDAEVADVQNGDDLCDTVVACARLLAGSVIVCGKAPDFERTLAEAALIHILAVSAVRWGECELSSAHPEAPGQLIARMIIETQSVTYRVRAISGEFRMAPWRAQEILNYRDHCSDGEVDFESWAAVSADPEFVRNLQVLFTRD